MLESSISDQKRLVRGELWLAARGRLRARDHVHHGVWNVMMIAGPSPAEEINAIRECMHHAYITAVDIDHANVLKAIDAGTNDAYACDIGSLQRFTNGTGTYTKTMPPNELADKKFDVISLDLTGPANEWLMQVVRCYWQQLTAKGVMMVTFSYGRDVVEALTEEWDILHAKAEETEKAYKGGGTYPLHRTHYDSAAVLKDIPEQVAIRVWSALRTRCVDLETCIQYRGHRMPMVACLLSKNRPVLGVEFKALEPDDLQYALTNENLNLSNLYASPVERIETFRAANTRKLAAHKAVETRRARESMQARLQTAWENASDEERVTWWNKVVRPGLHAHLIKNGWTPPVTPATPMLDYDTKLLANKPRSGNWITFSHKDETNDGCMEQD